MRRVVLAVVVAGHLLSMADVAFSGAVSILGGDVSLVVSSATAGQDPDPAIDCTTASLRYRRSPADPPMKVTVETNLGSPSFILKTEAINATGGTSAGEIVLSTTAQDFLTDVVLTVNRSCDISYTSIALASDGTGSDAHRVTYTIVAQ